MKWAIFSFLVCFLSGCSVIDPLNYESSIGVPEGTIAERQAWGEKHLGSPYQNAIDWIHKAKVIKENLGTVTHIAPVDKPNYIESFFTDGLFGNFTIEIIGDRDKAILNIDDLAPCYLRNDGMIYICFKKGILSTEYSRIPVHSSGVRQVEFNRIDNKDEIAKLTEEIEGYGDLEILKEDIVLEKLFIQRYQLHLENEDFANAISDLGSAIAIISKRFNQNLAYKDLEETEKDHANKLDRYQYWLAQAYYDGEQFDKAAKLFKRSLDTKLSRGFNQVFDEQQLELWIAKTRAGKIEIANQELKESLTIAEQKKDSCYLIYGQYLLGDITSDALLKRSAQPVSGYCNYIDRKQRVDLAYFYIGQKEIAQGQIKSGRKNLQKSLENGDVYRFITYPYSAAVKELSKVLKPE